VYAAMQSGKYISQEFPSFLDISSETLVAF
jgi:hypothetical protein